MTNILKIDVQFDIRACAQLIDIFHSYYRFNYMVSANTNKKERKTKI